jgi:tetratricopeptide (TPR) repeat protein
MSGQQLNTFEITIQRKAGQSWPLVIRHNPGEHALALWSRGELEFDPKKLEGLSPTSREFGQSLGKALFQDDIRDAFVRAVAEAKSAGEALRMLLFVEAEDLRTLHWEQLHAPFDRGWDYLLLNQSTPFSLYLPSQIERRFPPIGRRDLRALILVAGAEELEGDWGLAPFDVDATVASVRTALGEIPSDALASTSAAYGAPSLDTLSERLVNGEYTLLHIVTHGAYNAKRDETALYFPKEGRRGPVTSSELIERLSRMERLPRFTFLATCESADPQAESGLGGLAQRLVRELGMPAVLAMTDRVAIPTAQALASSFYLRLREHGEVDRALSEALGTLQGHYDVTVPALFSRLGGRPLFSDTLDRPLTDAEIRFGLDQLPALVEERAPVLTVESEALAAKVNARRGIETIALSAESQGEHDLNLNALNQLCIELLDMSFNALALGNTPPAYDARCPFPGLMSFRPEDHEFFFGREALVEKLQERLKQHNFLAILGPSGSGKSSLVLAGLVPRLDLPWAYLTPGNDPSMALETIKDEHQLIVVDQFEELFTLTTIESSRQEFIDCLLELDQSRKVVLTMRADFWGEIARYSALRDEMQAHQELVSPMSPHELHQAIDRQAEKVGLRFEADLSQDILEDVQDEPGAMPLLQHALLLLWERRHGRWLRLDEYRAIGGVPKAIAQTADSLYESLSPAEQVHMRDIFMRLTRLDDQSALEVYRDTRRRVNLQELIPAGKGSAQTIALVNKLADVRLVVTSKSPGGDEQLVEVAHEALIRHWPRLSNWLDENRENLLRHQQLTDAVDQWRKLNHDPGALYRGIRLQQALELAINHPDWITRAEQEYLEGSRENARQEAEQGQRLSRARQTQSILAGTATLLIIGLLVVLAVNGFFAPRKMSGIFNVAVADFGEVGPDGQVETSETGQQISGWALNYLREILQDDPNVEIWPRRGGPLDRTRLGLVPPSAADETATDVNASLIYYGNIESADPPAELVLGFYIAPQFEYNFEDIQGNYTPGRPIRIADMGNPGPSVQAELEKQSSVIAWLTIGLTQVQLGESEQASQAFNKAAEIDPHSAIVQFFIGRENLFLADRYPDQREAYQQAAEEAFQKAIVLDDQYARAYIGLGSVYTDRAASLINNALTTGQAIEPQARGWTDQAVQAYQQVLDLEPDSAEYGNPVADVARMALGHAYRLQGQVAYLQSEYSASLISYDQALTALEEVRPVFEASVEENESQRRYLAQVYEYLGETYKWQGFAFEQTADYVAAIQAYEQALEAFQQCIAQAENTPDRIIQDEIVGQSCQPRVEETQYLYETLTGEQ